MSGQFKVRWNIRYILSGGRHRPNRSSGGDLLNLLVLLLFGCFMILPLVYTVCNAVKPLDELFVFPPRFFVRHPTLDNFFDVFALLSNSWVPFSRYLFNTLFVTLVGTIGHIILASLCAYAMAKLHFFGRNALFNLVVVSLMFSPVVTAIPNYLTVAAMGWVDTYWALIVPAFASSLGLFLMKQFMETVPDSILESGRIDGASEFKVFWRLAMPMVKPGWLTLFIFSFQSLWNSTGGTFIYSEQLKPLPYAMNQILQGGVARAGMGAAVAFLLMTVPILCFIVSQSSIITTMASSGIKE